MTEPSADFSRLDAYSAQIQRAPEVAYDEMRRSFSSVAAQFLTYHLKTRMRGGSGITQRSGQAGLAGSRQFEATGSSLSSLAVDLFIGPPGVRYAAVQEFGTVGAGGTLPDIKPKTAKLLSWVGNDGMRKFAKSVAIRPRLGWRRSWDEFERNRNRILDRGMDRLVERLA